MNEGVAPSSGGPDHDDVPSGPSRPDQRAFHWPSSSFSDSTKRFPWDSAPEHRAARTPIAKPPSRRGSFEPGGPGELGTDPITGGKDLEHGV